VRPRTFVIAEVAGCHDGDINRAVDLIKYARDCGADAVKFQWLSSPERLAERRRAPAYLDAYRTIAFPREWLKVFQLAAEIAGLEFMCTAYLSEDVPVLAPHLKRFKISSFESGDAHFVAQHAEFPDHPLILSAGMGGYVRVREAVKRYVQVRGPKPNEVPSTVREVGDWISVLHCVSAYPCPPEQANLAALRPRWDWESANRYAGYSDHTRHPWTGALAVAAGARIVEFHMRAPDTRAKNADYAVSRDPEEAAEYVRGIRAAEVLCGEGESRAMPAEQPMEQHVVTGR